MKVIHVLGGGTFSHVRAHTALAMPAFGNTARQLAAMYNEYIAASEGLQDWSVKLHLTKMADPSSNIITNDDVSRVVDELVADPSTKIIVFNVALCDFTGEVDAVESGKHAPRLSSSTRHAMLLTPAEKIIDRIRKHRKDIFLIGFKTTAGASPQDQYNTAISRMKRCSANIMLANDITTRTNMIVVPEEAHYGLGSSRRTVLMMLVDMSILRAQLTFTRSTVIDGAAVAWESDLVPSSLRTVINHVIQRGAYKPVNGVTAGHFAVRVSDTQFITSIRKRNFNNLAVEGMVLVESDSPDRVIAHGAKPSVGGQSQRNIFRDHNDVDCIVHFHCPPRPGISISTREQYPYECGSHECGRNTSSGLELYDHGIKAVYLDRHGPNIVFNRAVDPNVVIGFIETHFDLSRKTDEILNA